MAKNVAKKEDQLPAELMKDVAADAGAGLEGADKDSYAIPFLQILQTNSPQVLDGDAEQVEGARPGMILETVTRTLYDGKEGVEVVPCAFMRSYVEWRDRDEGGGFIAEHEELPANCTRDERGRYVPPGSGDTYLNDTRKHYVLILTGDRRPALVSMTSTQIKKSRRWNTLMSGRKIEVEGKQLQAPTWLYSYVLRTKQEQNDLGKWYGWEIDPGTQVTTEVYQAAKAFRAAVQSGQVKEAPPEAPADSTDDIPF